MKKQEQIDIVRKMIADGVVTQEQAAKYFPELAEGEGERTWIINYLSNRILNSTIIAEKENLKKAIAWLEKQGEQKPTIEMITPEESLGIDSDTYNKIVNECIYGEQKPAGSEEDEKMLSDIVKDLVHPWNEYIPDRIEDEIKWLKNRLKSLRPQSTWKPSDEQIMALRWVLNHIPYSSHKEEINGLLEQYLKGYKNI